MKILIMTQYFWPESFLVNGLAADLKKNGHEVQVITGLPNYPSGKVNSGYGFFTGPWYEVYEGVDIYRVPLVPRGNNYLSLFVNYCSFVFFGSLFSFFKSPKDIDVILCFGVSPITSCLPALVLKWKIKKPVALWIQDLWPESLSSVGVIKSKWILQLVELLVKFIYAQCDLILTQSEAFIPRIRSITVASKKIEFLPNWAEPLEKSGKEPAWVTELPKGFKIGFAGNLGKVQDLQNLIEAASCLKMQSDIKWVVVGDGSEKAWLADQIEQRDLKSSVYLLDRKPYDDMAWFFQRCDALLVSLIDTEILSLTVPSKFQAYLAAGRPIISSLRGEGEKLIQASKSGVAIEPQSPDQLVGAVLKLKSLSPVDRQILGENGRQYFIAHFEKKLVINRLLESLAKTIKQQTS